MLGHVFAFEVRFQVRQPLFFVSALVFFLLAFFGTASETLSIGGGTDNLNLNASFAVMQTLVVFVVLAMFLVVAFVAGPLVRDLDGRTAEQFFSTGISRSAYLWGRFLGAFLVAYLGFLAAIAGVLVGLAMPWLDPERLGPFSLSPFLFSAWAIGLPGLLVPAALFYYVAALTRSLIAAYVVAVGLMAAYVVLRIVTDPEIIEVTALLDPFGALAFAEATRYWTVFDKNEQVLPLASVYFANRALWLAIAAGFLVATQRTFRFSLDKPRWLAWRPRWRRASQGARRAAPAAMPRAPERPSSFAQWRSQTRFEVTTVLKSPAFAVLLVLGVANVLGFYLAAISQFFGTTVYPLTPIMANGIASAFVIVVWVVLVWYAGELVFRERTVRVAEIVDATPHPNAVPLLAKLAALWVIIAAMLLAATLTAVSVQLLKGYTRIDPGYYAVGVFFALGTPLAFIAAIAVFLQALTANKYLGMLATLVVLVGMLALPGLGFEHRLLRIPFGGIPASDMNRFGHYLTPMLWDFLYWGFICALLLLAAHLAWVRGLDVTAKDRWRRARERWRAPLQGFAAVCALGALGAGGWIFYNTNVLNEYRTSTDGERLRAEYEKRYRQFRDITLPEVTDIYLEVDIDPQRRALEAQGHYWLENRTGQPLMEMHFTIPPDVDAARIELPGATLTNDDPEVGYRQYQFDVPLEPGERVRTDFAVSWTNPGFDNSGGNGRLVYNGTFVDNTDFTPLPGYLPGAELTDNAKRRKYGLPPVERAPDLDDASHYHKNAFGLSARSSFEAIVSTAEGQIGIAPGYLVDDWRRGDRRFFHYRMDEPIWGFYSIMSARYAVVRDRWKDVDLAVFHHPPHDYNVERMLAASKQALDYYSTVFAPYRYRQFRIFEFPAYRIFAQSFPNTIPYSEAIGFIADLRDPEDIDYVSYVTAHELAHQWWGHQVVSAGVQGASAITETLAQYSALMVMEHTYGRDHMHRFLTYELDRYLANRGGELVAEMPLLRVENQPYIHYRKGSLVMYALKDYLGEDAVNRALRSFLAKWGMSEDRFPTTRDLVAELRAVAPARYQDLITDLWEKIVVFDLRVTGAEVSETPDGRYRVAMTVSAHKYEADGEGREHEVPMRIELDVGAFADTDGPDPRPLWLAKRSVETGESQIEFTLDEAPTEVGLDPYNIMIDRNPADNRRRI